MQGDELLPGKRVKVDTDPIALFTDPRQLAALRTALAPLQPPPELLAQPLWHVHAAKEPEESPSSATTPKAEASSRPGHTVIRSTPAPKTLAPAAGPPLAAPSH